MTPERGLTKALKDIEFLKFILFDVLMATVFGLIAWIISKDNISSFLISLVVGSILLIAELRYQIVIAKDDLATMVGFEKEFFKDQFLLDKIQKIIKGYLNVKASGDTFFLNRAQDLIRKCNQDITNLQDGCMEIGPEEVKLKDFFKETNHSIFATSFVKTADFWFRSGGKEYLDKNFAAVKRGVNTTRVFIVEDIADITKDVRNLIRMQAEGKINVRIAFTKNLNPELLHDFAIFDDKYVLYLDLIPGSKEMRGARFYCSEGDLNKAKLIRERILLESEEYSEVLKRVQNS